jgi:hypothetical protein
MIKFKYSAIIAVMISCLLSSPANANNFKIGVVKKILPTTFCGSYMPDRKETVLLFEGEYSKYAWINIDGEDIKLKQTSRKFYKSSKRTIATYRNGKVAIIFDSKILRTIEGEMGTDESSDRVTFKVGNKSKTIQTTESFT